MHCSTNTNPTKPQTHSGNWRLCFCRSFTRAHLQQEIGFVILFCLTLHHPQRGTKKTHHRIVYHAICSAWHKVCFHTVTACQRCHTSTGNKVHGDKSQFVIFVISAVKKKKKKAALSSYTGFLSLLVSSAIPAGYLFCGIASIVSPMEIKCWKEKFKLVKWIVPLNSIGCQFLGFRGKTRNHRRPPEFAH